MAKVQPDRQMQQQMIVIDINGRRGRIAEPSTDVNPAARSSSNRTRGVEEGAGMARVLVDFDSGERLLVPRDLLRQEGKETFRLLLSVEELQQAQAQGKTLVVPVVQEEANVTRVVHTNRVEIAKTVHERMETVDEPLLSEEVEIERVTINRPLKSASISLGDGKAAAMEESQAAQVRREGDVLIIPLVEEVLVVEKRLVLREEVRIRKVQRETHAPQEVKLRNEQVEITRTPDTQTSSEDRPSKRTH